jgi:hypothetical protein
VSDFKIVAVLSALAAIVGDGPAKHTNSPVASINAERPLALIIIWQSPHLPAPESEMSPRCVSTAGQKKGIFGQDRAKAGQRRRTVGRFPPHFLSDFSFAFPGSFPRRFPEAEAAGAGRRNRCYEPARMGLAVSIPRWSRSIMLQGSLITTP